MGGIGTAFLDPAPQTFGNYPINTLIGPQFIQLDVSLAKSFNITERVSFRLRTDAANAFNHTNLGLPNGDVNASNAGQITGLAAAGSMWSVAVLRDHFVLIIPRAMCNGTKSNAGSLNPRFAPGSVSIRTIADEKIIASDGAASSPISSTVFWGGPLR